MSNKTMTKQNTYDAPEDLPILTAKQVIPYYNPTVKEDELPKRYLMEAEEFLKKFNSRGGFGMKLPQFCLPRRTLQFYSSPQVNLLPLPVYRNRHTAYYIVPDHYNRLLAITVLREKHYVPIKLIHKILDVLPEDKYDWLQSFTGTIRDLMVIAPAFKAGLGEEDVARIMTLKYLIMPNHFAKEVHSYIHWEEPNLKQYLKMRVTDEVKKLCDWVFTEQGFQTLLTVSKSYRGVSSKEEARMNMTDKRTYQEILKELELYQVDYE